MNKTFNTFPDIQILRLNTDIILLFLICNDQKSEVMHLFHIVFRRL